MPAFRITRTLLTTERYACVVEAETAEAAEEQAEATLGDGYGEDAGWERVFSRSDDYHSDTEEA